MTKRECKCGKPLGTTNKSGLCMPCLNSRTCSDCPAPISARSTGRCRKCANAIINTDPVKRAKSGKSIQLLYDTDPEHKAMVVRRSREAFAERMTDPEYAAWHQEQTRRMGLEYGSRNIGRTHTPEVRARAGRTISARKLAHIPAECREMYSALRTANLPAAERLRMAQEHADAERARVHTNAAAMRQRHLREKASRY